MSRHKHGMAKIAAVDHGGGGRLKREHQIAGAAA